jgi:hypothetical protein
MDTSCFRALSDEDVQRIEQTFSIKLPLEYIQLMQNYPHAITTEGMGGWADGELVLIPDPDRLININRGNRSPSLTYFGERGEIPWPNEYFAIGHDMGGGDWFIDTREEHPKVYFHPHATWDIETYYESLADAVKDLLKGSDYRRKQRDGDGPASE